MNYIFYDFETSGRNSDWDQILQLGAILTNDNEIVYSELVSNPTFVDAG